MPTIVGKLSIFGVAGDVTLTATGMIAPANMVTQGMLFRQTTEMQALKDGDGETISEVYFSPRHEITFSFCVKDATSPGNLANLKASIKVPDGGSLATIANATLPIYNGDWNTVGDVAIDPPAGGFTKYTITLKRSGKPTSGLTPTVLSVTP